MVCSEPSKAHNRKVVTLLRIVKIPSYGLERVGFPIYISKYAKEDATIFNEVTGNNSLKIGPKDIIMFCECHGHC